MFRQACILAAVFWFAASVAWSAEEPNAGQARTWTNNSGKYKVDARFVDLENQAVRLKKQDGEIIVVPLQKRSDADRHVAQRLAVDRLANGVVLITIHDQYARKVGIGSAL